MCEYITSSWEVMVKLCCSHATDKKEILHLTYDKVTYNKTDWKWFFIKLLVLLGHTCHVELINVGHIKTHTHTHIYIYIYIYIYEREINNIQRTDEWNIHNSKQNAYITL